MAGLGTRGTVSGKVQYQGRGMWAELEIVSKRSSTLLTSKYGLPHSTFDVPTDSGRNTLRLTQEV